MHYYIDGYNLLFRVVDASEDLQNQREAVLEELARKAQVIDLSATIVFDAHYQPGPVTRGHFKNLEVVYTSEKESADDYIHRAVTRIKNPRFITVVTSDKKLAWLCRLHGANTESISAFLTWLNRRYQNEQTPREAKKIKVAPQVIEQLPDPPPKPGTTSYYEAIFEEEIRNTLPLPTPKPLPPKPPRQVQSKPAPEEKRDESDYDRWLRLFGGS